MSELTLTLLRLGLLALLWIFIFSVVGVLRTDIYGTAVSRRGSARRASRPSSRTAAPPRRRTPAAAAAGAARCRAGTARAAAGGAAAARKGAPTTLVVTEGPLTGTSLPLRSGGILIGRNPECALVLDDDYASGRHARIFPARRGLVRRGPGLDATAPTSAATRSPAPSRSRSAPIRGSATPRSNCGG